MKKLFLTLTLILTVILSLGFTGQPVYAQTGPADATSLETTLAEAAAKSFLVILTRPDLAPTLDFYLVDGLADNSSVLAELQANPAHTFEITHSGWLDDTTYQVVARLQPDQRTLALQTQHINGRWRVAALDLAASPTTNTAPAAPATAAPAAKLANPGLPGRLVFQTHSGGDIYTLNADGSGLRFLTTGLDPQLAPDGAQLAFTRWQPRFELFTLDLATGHETARTHGWRQMKAPTWSADGARLIFSYQSGGRLEDEQRRIDLAQAARNEDNVRVPAQARDVEVEDGVLSYRLPMDAHWSLQQLDLTTGLLQDVPTTPYAYSPAAHPTDPNRLLFTVGGRGIALFDAASQTSQPVTTDPNDRAPVLAPDGQKVAVSYWQNGHWEIHTFNLDGSQRQRLTETPLSVLAAQTTLKREFVDGKERFVAQEQQHWNNAAPAWSPDGRQIAFLTDRTGRWEIWLMAADGSGQRPMFPNGVLDGLTFEYDGVDEHMLSWR